MLRERLWRQERTLSTTSRVAMAIATCIARCALIPFSLSCMLLVCAFSTCMTVVKGGCGACRLQS